MTVCHCYAEVTLQTVTFDDLKPAGVTLKQCWCGMGMDGRERIYIGWTSDLPDGREDFLVFSYDPDTGERKYLGSFIDASTAAGN